MDSKRFYLKYDPSRSSVDAKYDNANFSVQIIWDAAYNSSILRNVISYTIRVGAYIPQMFGYRSFDINWSVPSIGVYGDDYNNPSGSKSVILRSASSYGEILYNDTNVTIHERANMSGIIDYQSQEIVVTIYHNDNSKYTTFTSGSVETMQIGAPARSLVMVLHDPGVQNNVQSDLFEVEYMSSFYFSPHSSGEYNYVSFQVNVDNGSYDGSNIIVGDTDIIINVFGLFSLTEILGDGANLSVTDSDGVVYVNGDLIRYGKKIYITASPSRGYVLTGMTIDGVAWDYNATKTIDSYSYNASIIVSATPRYTVSVGHSGTFQRYAMFIYHNGSWGLYQPLIYKDGNWEEYE